MKINAEREDIALATCSLVTAAITVPITIFGWEYIKGIASWEAGPVTFWIAIAYGISFVAATVSIPLSLCCVGYIAVATLFPSLFKNK